MDNRTSETIITFHNSFSVGVTLSDQPAGSYRLSKEQELIEGISYPAFRTVSMLLQIPAIDAPSMTTQFIPVTGSDLDAALQLDASRSGTNGPTTHADPTSMADRARNFDPTLRNEGFT
jgi:hypothetical protein